MSATSISLNKPKLDNLAGEIWKSAVRLRGKFRAYEYQSVILPIIVIRRLDSDRYTRMGAPIRHVTSALCREHASRRLLLILSDGKPNDVDVYEGRYGVEDTRQAVAEARRQGVTVLCLTVDREAPRYAGRVLGRGGFAVLHRAEQLPAVLIEVLRQLIRS